MTRQKTSNTSNHASRSSMRKSLPIHKLSQKFSAKLSKVRMLRWDVTSSQGTSLRCQGTKRESCCRVVKRRRRRRKLGAEAQHNRLVRPEVVRVREADLYLGFPQNPPSLSVSPSVLMSPEKRERERELQTFTRPLSSPETLPAHKALYTQSTVAVDIFLLISQPLFLLSWPIYQLNDLLCVHMLVLRHVLLKPYLQCIIPGESVSVCQLINDLTSR